MTRATEIIAQTAVVFIRNGQVFANSRDVARHFQKRHDNVLRDIRNILDDSASVGVLNFEETPYVDLQNGQTYRSFDMDRDAFSILTMGFTGARAMAWKMDFVRAFNAMEAGLKARAPAPAPAIDLNDPSVLRGMLLGYTEQLITLKAEVEIKSEQLAIAAPKTQFYDDFAEAEGLVLLTDIGRVLGVKPIKLLRHLVDRGVLFKTSPSAPLRARGEYVAKGWFVTKTTLVDDVARAQTYATPRGLQGVAGMLDRTLDLFGRGSVAYGREGALA